MLIFKGVCLTITRDCPKSRFATYHFLCMSTYGMKASEMGVGYGSGLLFFLTKTCNKIQSI